LNLWLCDAEELRHFIVKKALTGLVGLNPLAIKHELRDAAFASFCDDCVGGAGGGFDVDLCVGNRVGREETFGLAAVAAPVSGIYEKLHVCIVADVWVG
jgi:hypothetical protein